MQNSNKEVIQLKISLAEIEPQIWRRIILSTKTSLHELHRIIQLMFEWYDYHLYEFTFAGERYQFPGEEAEGLDSTRIRIAKLKLSVGDRFTYTYDFGDDWVHNIMVEPLSFERVDPDGLPYVVAGERRGPPEDCGSTEGFQRFLDAINNPEDPEHDEYLTWAGDDYIFESFDVRTVRHAILLASAWGRTR